MDPQLEQLVSTPETKDALKKYPKNAKGTIELDFQKYPCMSKDETPWDYAYRTQTKVELKTTAYKEYLGDIEDPFPITHYQDGMMMVIEPPPFPPAIPSKLICGDAVIPIMLQRTPCLEYQRLCLKNVAEDSELGVIIDINTKTGKTDISLDRKYDAALYLQLNREKLICNLQTNDLVIKKDSTVIFHTKVVKESLKTEFFKMASSMIPVIENLLYIEECLNCKFICDISKIGQDDFYYITLIASSLRKKWYFQKLEFDNSLRCHYNNFPDNIDKEPDENAELTGSINNFSVSFLGVQLLIGHYILVYRKCKINNIKSVLKNIKRKKDNIMLTIKPIEGYECFERYSLAEDIKVIEKDDN